MTDTESPATDAVRLLSYNIRYAGLDTGMYTWEQRRDGIASVIRFHRPDLVTLQEVWMTQLDDLSERLSSLEWVGKRVLDGEHTPVGYRPDRFTVTDWEVFALSDTPDEYDMLGWDATLPRFTTEVSFQDTDTGKRFAILSTHFDHEGTQARLESARLIRDRVANLDMPVVVAGDLNCGRDDPPYRVLTGVWPRDRLSDARITAAESPQGPEMTFHNFDAPQTGETLDHVLVTDSITVKQYIVATNVDRRGQYPSDHFPVIVDFAVQGTTPRPHRAERE